MNRDLRVGPCPPWPWGAPHARGVNQVERWFAALTEKQIKRGSHTSVKALETAIREFIDAHNENPTPFHWTKSADQILASVAKAAERTLRTHRPKPAR